MFDRRTPSLTQTLTTYREISADRLGEFLRLGYKQRRFFPHRFYFLPKGGPDGLKMARRMCGVNDPNKLWEVVLYARPPFLDEFPRELFFDSELVWHQQQFGQAGQIATANLVVKGADVYGMNYLSDIVQRISRRKEFKTRIENRFKGWPSMLLNSIVIFAVEKRLKNIYSPSSELVLRHIPPSRGAGKELFERVYDAAVCEQFPAARKDGWWRIEVARAADKAVVPEKQTAPIAAQKRICLCHDVERGWGHRRADPELAKLAERTSPGYLDRMLAVERSMNVKATYHVVGGFFNEVREKIESDGHSIAFHSYDHQSPRFWPLAQARDKITRAIAPQRASSLRRTADQLAAVRQLDYRIKGYRPAQSKLTREFSDRRLCFHNFEWLASSAYSLGIGAPKMENRIVKIPILFDDFGMYKRGMSYAEWERRALDLIGRNDFVAFSLHDCYAQYWLPPYGEFLKKVGALGAFATLDQVAGDAIFAGAE
jgi:hypothetical protein